MLKIANLLPKIKPIVVLISKRASTLQSYPNLISIRVDGINDIKIKIQAKRTISADSGINRTRLDWREIIWFRPPKFIIIINAEITTKAWKKIVDKTKNPSDIEVDFWIGDWNFI